ncbi:hypothetical protein AAG570_009641 [Ranatra chinensis]|uniref:Beta-1,4-N-acetylgalactosaminyltransferase n=1 Tax=Ranatra chinensis TaxID=642074 RepID=A0ABD0YQ97_9HEMI
MVYTTPYKFSLWTWNKLAISSLKIRKQLGNRLNKCIIIVSVVQERCDCPKAGGTKLGRIPGRHLLGVVVPFRDRFEELLEFAPHLHEFLRAQNIDHRIFVINQVDQYRFNRASLINAGFQVAVREGCDYVAMHDVDLLPLNPELSYDYPAEGSLHHLASPEFHPKYHYPTFVGGIIIVRKEDFISVNGMSNKYWGWGLEDDEFYVRVKEAGLNVTRPTNLTTGIENTFRHIHDKVKRKRDMAKCYNQREVTRRRDRQTGLKDPGFYVRTLKQLVIENTPVSVVNTELRCNRTLTPWCLCSSSSSSSSHQQRNTNKQQEVDNLQAKKRVEPVR